MIAPAFLKLLDGSPPAWVRKVEVAVIMGVFAEAFDVEAPRLEGLSAEEALCAFQEFSVACMEAALIDDEIAARYRERLRAGGFKLGSQLRSTLHASSLSSWQLTRFMYRGIDIELCGDGAGDLRFGPCSFSKRYTPQDCWFMSAFDEGFICGINGLAGPLSFACRITEGAPHCCAHVG